jgi:hypothetical protein
MRAAISVEEATLLASDGAANAEFGTSVAISNDTALVGAYGDDEGRGAAYVFVRSGSEWVEQQKLVATVPQVPELFGRSVALSGDTALIGAPFTALSGGIERQGSAYVFQRAAGAWSEVVRLTAEQPIDNALYGYSVALTDDLAFVGAPNDRVTANGDEGSVDVRRRSDWSRVLRVSDGASGDNFGDAIAANGDALFVGAPGSRSFTGAVHRYQISGEELVWQDTVRHDEQEAAGFGTAIDVSSNTALIGAFADTVESNNPQGSVYVLERVGGSWQQTSRLHSSDGELGDSFGIDVAISGDIAVIGAAGDTIGANGSQGSAYVFVRSGDTWVENEQLLGVTEPSPTDAFGTSVAVSGHLAIVGADGWGTRGRAHAFLLDPSVGGGGGGGGVAGQAGAGAGGESGGAGEPGDDSGSGGGASGAGTGGRADAGGAGSAGRTSAGESGTSEAGSGADRRRSSSSESGCGCRTASARFGSAAHILVLGVLAMAGFTRGYRRRAAS